MNMNSAELQRAHPDAIGVKCIVERVARTRISSTCPFTIFCIASA